MLFRSRLVDVRAADERALRQAVGSLAEWLQRLARGDDPREVRPDRPWKSISTETTYPEDLESVQEMRAEVERLARKVAATLERKKLYARTVTLKARYGDFTTVTRSHSAAPSRDPDAFAERALALLERTDAPRRPVRLLGVGSHGLEEESAAGPRPGDLFLE